MMINSNEFISNSKISDSMVHKSSWFLCLDVKKSFLVPLKLYQINEKSQALESTKLGFKYQLCSSQAINIFHGTS